jgi:aminoglycoside phosphotransferase (APT) family kinase protein
VIAVQDQAGSVTDALQACGELETGDSVEHVRQLAGGWSRHSYIATARTASGVVRRYVVRVRPEGGLLDTDLELEYRLYRHLEDVDIPTPRVFALVEEPDSPFGGPFIVMEHVDGVVVNTYSRDDLGRLEQNWQGSRSIARQMLENLVRIHGLGSATLPAALPTLEFDDVVARWREVYEDRGLVRDPVVEEAFDWVAARAPQAAWPGLVHGDYRLGNMLVDGERIRAILDWELAYQGDIRFDLGYLALPRTAGKHLRARTPLMAGFADRGWFLDRYAELTGRLIDPESLATFQMLGNMMLLATQFTASWMYHAGRTADVRMAWSRFSFAGLRQDMIELMGW